MSSGSRGYSENGLTAAVNNPFHSSVGVQARAVAQSQHNASHEQPEASAYAHAEPRPPDCSHGARSDAQLSNTGRNGGGVKTLSCNNTGS